MAESLKIVLVEDNPVDADLVEFELQKAKLNYDIEKIDNRDDFIHMLVKFKPDVILSDFNLLDFDGLEALAIAKKTCIETPFILVTGNLDEETAVNCIKLGAWDYILKDKLTRLVPAIKNALKLKAEIGEKQHALDELKKSEAKYQDLYDNAPDMFLSVDEKTGIITNCNKTLLEELGYSMEEFVGKEIFEFYTPEAKRYAKEVLLPQFYAAGLLKGVELQVIKRNGSVIDVSLTNSAVYDEDGDIIHSRSIWRDITEKKKTELTLKKSEEKYRAMLEANQDIVIIKSPDNRISYMNLAAKIKSKDHDITDNCYEALFGLSGPCLDCKASNCAQIKTHHREITDPEDNTIYLASYFPIKNIDGTDSIMCIYKDITSLRNIENERMRLLNILEATQNEIYIIDHIHNKLKYVNESAVKNTGFSKTELINLSPFDLLFDFNVDTIDDIIKSIGNKTDGKIVFESKITRKDKSVYPIEIHLQLIVQQKEKLILAVIIDNSERQKKEELILKLSKGIEQSPTSIVITDLNGNIEFINPKFTDSSGYSFSEVNGKNSSILKSGHTSVNEYQILWQTITNGGIWHGELLNKKKNGELYWEEAIIGPIKDKHQRITHFIGIKQDISNRKKIEEELKAEKNSLTKRVDERTADLSKLNAELSKAVRMKDEFLANMSHELRTPLNSILGLSEVLQDGIYGQLNPNQVKSLKTIEDSGRHLLALINDILDVAKVEAGKVELEISDVHLFGLCQASLNFVKQTALKKNITYSFKLETSSEILYADERRMKQILVNLLSNAVKFTPENGEIGLIVSENYEEEHMDFTVWDTGIGIKQGDFENLFKPFVQIDSSLSREYNGTGLGLALVKNLTELHGGSISVVSTFGKGSSFTISLPVKTKPSVNQANLEAVPVQLTKEMPNENRFRILIVKNSGNELADLEIFANQLDLVCLVLDSDDGLEEKIIAFKPDLVFFDQGYTDGLIFNGLLGIDTNKALPEISVVVITDGNNSQEIVKTGKVDSMVKPITLEGFDRIIKKYKRKWDIRIRENNSADKALILIAEDNENNIDMLLRYFNRLNYTVLVARNGKEALSICSEKFPDIILMDIQMPGMDGIEATQIIRNDGDKRISDIPIIALTALVMPGDEMKCFNAGVNEYVKKPISMKNLVARIEELLSKKRK
jgi:PAS domain S-box-containing protein